MKRTSRSNIVGVAMTRFGLFFSAAMIAAACLGPGSLVCARGASAADRPGPSPAGRYHFDRTISRPVLENYLARSVTMEGLLNGRGDLDDNLRMLKATGAKFIGRSLCLWGGEANLLRNLDRARQQLPKLHAADPDMILQACIFEIVTTQVEQVPVPEWAFTALGQPVEKRNFRYADMLYPDGRFKDHWRGGNSVPDVSRRETKLWFYFLGASFIDVGCEAIHLGQTELMNKNDRNLDHYAQVLALIRSYAAQHARRHMVLLDSHVPSGGLVREGQLLMDFHSFPLRIMETPDKPQEAILKVGFSDGIYGRSKGGTTPSGWKCEHLPYLVEIDNWGVSRTPGQAKAGGIWIWGYDEITWFAHQSQQYRSNWLRYAWNWVRQTDANGFLQMPGSRTVRSPRDSMRWYYANKPSAAVPEGLGDEDAIRAVWGTDQPGQSADTPWLRGSDGPTRDMVLWYRQPAAKWLEAMPLGNGRVGAMVFGGMQSERIALNESTFWSGRPHDYDNPDAFNYFPQIRDLVFAGKFQEAERMADTNFYGLPAAQQAYQPLGDLLLSFDGVEKAEDYRRELDMETGVATITYRVGDTRFVRDVFVSYPDRVMVVRITADKPGCVSVQSTFKSPYSDKVTAAPGKLVVDGCWKGPITNNWLIAPVEGNGLRFQVSLVAQVDGGRTEAAGSSLRVAGANAVTFIVAAATSFVNYRDISGNPASAGEKTLAGVAGRSYATLRQRHEADFRALVGRVHLNVGDRSRNETPTDERLRAMRDGSGDPNLEALCFQFGRYLLASSSRAGGQPANLQGIWNEAISPSWGSKYTININTEMNYWPAEVCNLSECHQPLFDMLKDISVTGAKTAKVYYNCNGWVAHHNIDLWRGTAPVDAARFGMWPVGGAWLCQHVWEHYAFTGDRQFLREYYPILKGAAQFLLEVMIEDPKHHWLVTPFSMSPEHGYLDGNGNMAFLSPSPTMDVAIIRELFPHCIEAGKILDLDEDFRGKLGAALKRLPPYQISRRGTLQEWIEDWQPGNQGHNMSLHFTFYPGSSITLRGTPEVSAALLRGMEARRSRGGWPLAWDICMWARLERGDKVAAGLQTLVRNSLAPNLHNSGSNQSDASFGLTAGLAEALLQSHAGEISLLPALPESWSDGSVTGLRARGGFEVSMAWKNGKLLSAELGNATATDCQVRYGAKTVAYSVKPGAPVRLDGDLRVIR